MTALKPNQDRVKQRREEVIQSALRSKRFTTAQLTREASAFIQFCLSLEQIRTENVRPHGRD